MTSKKCTKCEETKPIECFSKRARSPDGHNPYCKECASADNAAWYAANKERKNAANAKWKAENPERNRAMNAAWRKATPERQVANAAAWYAGNKELKNAANAKWKKENPEKNRAINDAWAKENPERRRAIGAAAQSRCRNDPNRRPKVMARLAVFNAIQSGKLTRQACEVCGAESNIEAHHSDYSRPLDVNWLCREHHREWHRNNDINKETASQ